MTHTVPRSRRFVVALVAALASCGLATGCGSSDERVAAQDAVNTRSLAILTSADVNRAPAGSPERTLLEWWRLMQFRGADDALKLWTPAVREELAAGDYEESVYRYFSPWIQHVEPEILDTRREGADRVTLYVRGTFFEPVGTDLIRRRPEFISFGLVKEPAGWRLGDAFMFREQTRLQRENVERAAESDNGG